jgi:hypothetical protein
MQCQTQYPHPKICKDLNSIFFLEIFYNGIMLVMFKAGSSWFFNSTQCASGTIVDGLLITLPAGTIKGSWQGEMQIALSLKSPTLQS